MQIIDLSQRDYLSVVSDVLSILAIAIGGFIVFKFSKKENTQEDGDIKNFKKIKIKEKGRTILGRKLAGTYEQDTEYKTNATAKAKKETTTGTTIKLKNNKGGDK